MITDKGPTMVQKSNVGETKRATIKASAKIFNFFADQIYSDKYTAIWRELVANAVDAQKMNGNTTRPIVTAPSMLEPYAKVRDFGCSMDHAFMMDKFMAFTDASTKEHSDDFIGGFGIGSKAPLSYTDQYSIRCFMDGVVRVYSIFKDEEGCPSIAFLSEDATTEADGVEVGFPVRQEDIHRFTDTLVKTLQYSDPLPVLEGTDLKLEPIVYDVKGPNWGIRTLASPDRSGRIIVGGVSYPLNQSQIGYEWQDLRQFSTMGLDIFLGIGEVNIALSREQVTHDEELFKKLTEIIKNIGPEFGKQLSTKFASAKTLWEAKALLTDASAASDYNIKKLLVKHAAWKGQPLTESITRPKDLDLLIVSYGTLGYNSGAYGIITTEAISPKFRAWESHARFHTNTYARIVLVDTEDKPILRMRTLIDQNPSEKILFIKDISKDPKFKWQQVLDGLGNPPADMIDKLSKYQPTKLVRRAGTSTRAFKCYVRDNRPYSGTSNVHTDLPTDGGMYVVMNNFTPETSAEDIAVAQKSQPKNTVWMNLTDFRASGVEANPLWYSVEEGVKKVKDEYRSNHKNLAEAQGWWEAYLEEDKGIIRALEDLAVVDKFPKRGPLSKLLALQRKHEDVTNRENARIRKDLLGIDGSKHKDRIMGLVQEVRTKHPLIAEICENRSILTRVSHDLINRLF